MTHTVTRTPLWFGPADRPLFGWYHAPRSAPPPALAVVVCPPLGIEYFNSYRSLRHLADRLAMRGVPALRFDYDGTGNSAGGDEDPARMTAWIESVLAAITRVRAESDAPHIALAGVRMGATLAALVARQVDVSQLVLWAPCVTGRTYVRELRALALTGASAGPDGGDAGDFEAGGCITTLATQREIAAIDLRETAPRAGRILIGCREDRPERHDLTDTWSAPGCRIEERTLPGFAEMMALPHHSRVPYAAIDGIVEWIVAGAEDTGPAVAAATRIDGPAPDALIGGVSESFVRFGDGGSLFGILTEPARGAPKSTGVVVLSSAGATHHVGPGRLYVQLGRALSRAGLRCLRLDLPGIGDSDSTEPGREGEPYVPGASAVIAAAIEALPRAEDPAPVILMGLCSGAHAAFHAALELDASPVTEAVLINPLTFYYRPGMSLDEPDVAARSFRHYALWLRTLHGWSRLLRVDLTALRKLVATLFRPRAWARRRAMHRKSLAADLERVARQGRSLTFVFSRFDPGYGLLISGGGRAVPRLIRGGQIKLWFIDGANHTFDRRTSRAEMVRSVTTHLAERYLKRRTLTLTPSADRRAAATASAS